MSSNSLKQLTQGESLSWTLTPLTTTDGEIANAANGWDCKIYLRTNAAIGVTLTGSDESGLWRFNLPSATSALMQPGNWYWQAFSAKGFDNRLVESGGIVVQKSAAYTGTAGVFDGRTQAERMLEAVTAAIEAKITNGAVAEYSIGNRSVKSIPVSELLQLQARLKNQVTREKIARGESVKTTLKARIR